jgi:ribosome-binding protein aMBF1 (putative translation factor)
MSRVSWSELKERKVSSMSVAERAEYEPALAESRFALEVGERIRTAREAAGISQRELARRMSTSQASVGRLESGSVAATLATLQRAALALDLRIEVKLRRRA